MSARLILELKQVPRVGTVRPLKEHASWVQNVIEDPSSVPIRRGRRTFEKILSLVREDRDGQTNGAPVAVPAARPDNYVWIG